MKYARILVMASVLAALAACQQNKSTTATSAAAAPATDTSNVIATVNGTPITEDLLNVFVLGLSQGKTNAAGLNPDQRTQVIDQIIRTELVAQDAEKQGVDKTPATANQLAVSHMDILEQGMAERLFKDKPPSDQELHAEYDSQVANLPKTEYHARHILVGNEAFAVQIIDRLKKGEKFEDLAKKNSMDTSKDNGGDLGWFTPDHMEKPFADAVVALQPGTFTRTPVQTHFGFHVIQLVETRPLQAPPFDQVKDRIARIVETKKFKAYTDDLLAKAKVDRKTPAPGATPTTPPANKTG
jgi:peptidyl-prolyl cis-trans isomerase C